METICNWSETEPLTRAKRETRRGNAGLHDYALMGSARSLRKLHLRYKAHLATGEEPPTRYLTTLKTWSVRYDWQRRVAHWDKLERERVETAWRDRRLIIREREWEACQSLLTRAEEMLKFPISRRIIKDEVVAERKGQVIARMVTFEPVRWNQRDIARFQKIASELGRLAAEMVTERAAIEGDLTIVYKGNVDPTTEL
jgi:hypothetical protein